MSLWLAPAKLNLFLHVLGRRQDGYHLLQSLFCLIDWCDEIEIMTNDLATVTRQTQLDWPESQDLSIRAAKALRAVGIEMGVLSARAGCAISIKKSIPSGAGLGGGSSDAATTLLALNALWQLGLSRDQLSKIGLALGADVPFFLFGKPALVTGIGESMTSLTCAAAWFVVAVPPEPISTQTIFEDSQLQRDNPALPADELLAACQASRWVGGRNDLEPVAHRRFPMVRQWADRLKTHAQSIGLPTEAVRMSGSGGALFVSCATQFEAAGLAKTLVESGFDADRIRLCKTLARHPSAEQLP